MEPPPTFLINLDRSADRLAKSDAVLKKAGIPYERCAAVDGKTLDPILGDAAIPHYGRRLNPGEVGCFLSHRACAQTFLATGAPYGLVVEDDIALRLNGVRDLDLLWSTLNHFSDWDLMNLGRNAKKNRTDIGTDLWPHQDSRPYRTHYFPVTTTAILWSRDGAQKFLEISEHTTMPVDIFLRGWACKTGRGIAFDPSPFTIRGEDSVIDTMQITDRKRGKDRALSYQWLKLKRQITNHMNARKSEKAWQ